MSFLVILDRDGTLIVEKNYLAKPDEVEILDGVVDGLKSLKLLGGKFSVVTNQSGIGRGYYKLEDAVAVNDRMLDEFSKHGIDFSSIHICPHTPEDNCLCRKPKIKLLLDACEAAGLNAAHAFMVGDKSSDIEAGKNAGIRTILVRTGYGSQIKQEECDTDFIASDLKDAARWIENEIKKPG